MSELKGQERDFSQVMEVTGVGVGSLFAVLTICPKVSCVGVEHSFLPACRPN